MINSKAIVLTQMTVMLIVDRIIEGGNAIASVCPFVSTLFGTDLPLTLNFCMRVGHDHSPQRIEGQDQCRGSGYCGQSNLDRGQFVL